jgi:signal transduction histidine kinase
MNYKVNIKTRLSIQFTLLVFGILLVFSLLVYYFSYDSQLSKFRQNLLDRAQNTAILLINVQEVDSTLLKKIYQTTKSLEEEEIVLNDSNDKTLFSNKIEDLITFSFSGSSHSANPEYFSIGKKDGVLYNHHVKNQLYHVYVLAYDKYRAGNLRGLRGVLLWSIIFSLCLSIWTSYFFSKMAIWPISNIISKVKEINSSRLSSRLDEGKRQDEIEHLAITFNQMLSDLELVFRSQEEFVSNASHELRTPLAIMIAESDYIISRKRNTEEYEVHIIRLTEDLRKLNHLINSLLELAQLNRNKKISLSDLRIDELVFVAIHTVKQKYPGRKILPKIEYSDNDKEFIITGNQGLLEIAFKNLIDNSCKFSTADVEIKISKKEQGVSVEIKDYGVGIPAGEIGKIFKPFNRATNAKFIGGFGIGLSIVDKIMELNNAKINIMSILNEGSSFEIIFAPKTN